ncbi:MAG TPA: molybdopterin cofactor-binding domain-containing protein [Gammaproteobacteria bacterium]
MRKWTRRAVIGAGSLLGGGLVLGVGGVVLAPNRLRIRPDDVTEGPHLTTWVRITPDNQVVAIVPHCEMGQGAIVGLAMMLAEELEADFESVRIEEAPAVDEFANGYILRGFAAEAGIGVPQWLTRAVDYATFKVAALGDMQLTGGSTSTRATGVYGMRVAGAAAREMLIGAAAARFGVPGTELSARGSRILHEPSGRTASYGELASEAARIRPPARPWLKPRSEFRLVGTSQPRPDLPGKVNGSAEYGIDVALPDMLVAAIAQAPVPGGTLDSVDASLAESMPGVRKVVALENAVAVVADGYWQATEALAALEPKFGDAGRGSVSSADILGEHAAALDRLGAAPGAPADALNVAAEYSVPYLAHASLEPMAATARVANGRCEVWAGTQDPLNARRVAAEAAGLEPDDVAMHNLHSGGSFGRRLPGGFDYVAQAVEIAKSLEPRPVKLIWSREQDMQHDYYRDVVLMRMQAALGADGRPVSWSSRFTGMPFMDTMAAEPFYPVGESDLQVAEPPVHLRTGSWRSVAWSQHVFFMESFIDELAHAAGVDPLAYRRRLLANEPRHLAVLERAAAMAGWGGALPPGRARGVAIAECFGSIIAEVAEISLSASGDIRVHSVDAAVDCGYTVNPNQARAQIEGGIVFGLSAALYQEITVRDGAVVQRSFPDYGMIRLATAPRIRVDFIDSDAELGGLGEPGVPPVAPAVANALFSLTGERLRTLPLRPAAAALSPA